MNAARLFAASLLTVSFLAVVGPVRAADPATFTIGAYAFKRPPAWKWVPVPASSMRKAQLRVDGPDGAAGEVVFFTFGAGQGGGVEANIKRWSGQFEGKDGAAIEPVVETAEIKGNKITRVRIDSGTFSSGMPGGPTTPMQNYGLYGAIIESKDGDIFIKLTGPAALVKAASADFEGMVQSPF